MADWMERVFREEEDRRKDALGPCWLYAEQTRPPQVLARHGVIPIGSDRRAATAVIEVIDKARQTVALTSFLLEDGQVIEALLNAARRGVRVYVLNAAEARLEREQNEDSEFDRKVLEEHKRMLNRLAGHVLVRTARHYHAKAVVADAPHGPGVLLTANLTQQALERNEEMLVTLTPAECEQMWKWIRRAFWEEAEHELQAASRLASVKPLERVGQVGGGAAGRVVATSAGTQLIRDAAMELVRGARASLVVASFGWAVDHPLVKLLAERARSGLNLTVLARIRPAAMPALLALREAGATVYGFTWLHAKAIWSDTNEALVMSANLEQHGLDQGFELGVRLEGARAEAVAGVLSGWAAAAPARLEVKARLGDATSRVELWEAGRLVPAEVEETQEIDLGRVNAPSVDRLEVPRPQWTPPNGRKLLARKRIFTWKAVAPRLDPKAKEVRREVKKGKQGEKEDAGPVFPLFKEPSGRMVVVVNEPGQVVAAWQYAEPLGATAIVVSSGAGSAR
jgi:cardiolipin synthase